MGPWPWLLAATTAGLVVGAAVSCTLPVDTKTGCTISDDCVGERVCVDQECRDDACEFVCALLTEQQESCEALSALSTTPSCTATGASLEGVRVETCRVYWDRLHSSGDQPQLTGSGGSSDGMPQSGCALQACAVQCPLICERATACALATDVRACTEGCLAQRWRCDGPGPSSCTDVPTDVLCYESGQPEACV